MCKREKVSVCPGFWRDEVVSDKILDLLSCFLRHEVYGHLRSRTRIADSLLTTVLVTSVCRKERRESWNHRSFHGFTIPLRAQKNTEVKTNKISDSSLNENWGKTYERKLPWVTGTPCEWILDRRHLRLYRYGRRKRVSSRKEKRRVSINYTPRGSTTYFRIILLFWQI